MAIVAACAALGCGGALPAPAGVAYAGRQPGIEFTGTVRSIAVLQRRFVKTSDGTLKKVEVSDPRGRALLLADFDPRFALTVCIASTSRADGLLEPGQEKVFAIHSPARLFAAPEEEVVGGRYAFTLVPAAGGYENSYILLSAERAAE